MTVAHDIDLPALLAERLASTHPDMLRELLATFIHTLMGADADALCAVLRMVSAAPSAPIPATAIVIANSIPGQAVWIWRSLSCGRAPISPSGCWGAANAPNGPRRRWWPPAICWGRYLHRHVEIDGERAKIRHRKDIRAGTRLAQVCRRCCGPIVCTSARTTARLNKPV